jgi:hypothetical protein
MAGMARMMEMLSRMGGTMGLGGMMGETKPGQPPQP